MLRRIVSLLAASCVSEACGQPSWPDYPDFACAVPEAFHALPSPGAGRPLRILVMGDSQESVIGLSHVYIPALAAGLGSVGGIPETPWVPGGFSFGGGTPYAFFLVRAAVAAPGVVISPRSTLANTPGGLSFAQTSAITVPNANNDQRFGWLVVLDHDAAWTTPAALLARRPWMDVSQGVYVHITGRSFPGSSELEFKVSRTTGEPTYYGAQVSTHRTAMGLDDVEGTLKTQTFGPFSAPAGTKLQVEVFGADPTKVADIATVRFSSVAHPSGPVVTSLSEGGYRADSFRRTHPRTEEWIRAIAPDIVFLMYGANDAGQAIPLQAHGGALSTIIGWLRSVKPDTLAVLIPDVYRNLDAAPGSRYDLLDGYNTVAYNASMFAPNRALYINSRKMTEAIGWSRAGDPARFMYDGVHYSWVGAREKARIDSAAFLAFMDTEPPVCRADFNADGFIDLFDYMDFVECFVSGNCPPNRSGADFNGDAFVDLFDFIEFTDEFERGC